VTKTLQLNYLDTRELIKKCIRNDTGAQQELYYRFASKMLSICHRYASSKDDAEDIFQEGFLKIFENLNQLKNHDLIEWWMKKIFINESLKLYNSTKRIYLIEDMAVLRPAPEEEYGVSEKLGTDEITQLIQKLPDKMRMVFNMYVIEGFSHSEIAAVLNISEGTSKSNLHDARKTLQRKISALEKVRLLG
jgi:RNA polymerase sigma-70 factor (ECF subfamily)